MNSDQKSPPKNLPNSLPATAASCPEDLRKKRRRLILEASSLDRMLDYTEGANLLDAEAAEAPSIRLVWPEHVAYLKQLRDERKDMQERAELIQSSDDVFIIPGFFASGLRDVESGVIWLNAKLLDEGDSLLKLSLEDDKQRKGGKIEAVGAIPATVELLRIYLSFWRYEPKVFTFDWRKSLESAAKSLADRIRARISRPYRPLHLVAHSLGAVVARRALQLLGTDYSRRLVNNLVLLGPLTRGSCSPAQVLAGDPDQIDLLRMYGIKPPEGFGRVLQSFTALYQLLPFDDEATLRSLRKFNGVDGHQLRLGMNWAGSVDTQFFDDRTTIILGQKATPNKLKYRKGRLEVAEEDDGDGVVTDSRARLKDVRTYRLINGEHSRLLLYPEVHHAIRAIFKNESPRLTRVAKHRSDDRSCVLVPVDRWERDWSLPTPAATPRSRREEAAVTVTSAAAALAAAVADLFTETGELKREPSGRPKPPAPAVRRLRVFSFDPLLATSVNDFGIATFTLELPWEDNITPGPVGEYLEVIDYDPASQRFYHPVDLSHPRVIAQDGITPAESNPQFHQQMVYAVARATIDEFEHALGRVTLWAPHIDTGENSVESADAEFVPRLRIYPHGLREANAYYHPKYHAILFGYFSSREQTGGQTIPGGTVFTCQSYDIIAHETTHALLHGLHPAYLSASNRDVLAFHEAIADAVALFQKFGQVEVLRSQIARTRGDLRSENLLGTLAMQFGAAMGKHRGALRQYITVRPDPTLLQTTDEAHERGAILMAALFRAFLNIYENRTRDLYRIATNGTGKLPEGDIHPDLVSRLAIEASRAARHMLRMCVRALDYVPPVDLTFGEYLRALITADFDLVKDDTRGYRVSVVDAFRSWGIYPADVNVLDESAMIWDPPGEQADALAEILRTLELRPCPDRWTTYSQMRRNASKLRDWIKDHAVKDVVALMGLTMTGFRNEPVPQSYPREPKKRATGRSATPAEVDGVRFDVHNVRTCLRIGPNGQQVSDLIIEIVQRRAGYFEEAHQKEVDDSDAPLAFTEEERAATGWKLVPTPDFWFRGGCTLIVDRATFAIRYCVMKSIGQNDRFAVQREFERGGGFASLAATYFGSPEGSPFALLHGGQEEEIYGS